MAVKAKKKNPQDATMRNIKGKASKTELANLKKKLPAQVHEAVNDIDRRAGRQIDEIRGTVGDNTTAIARAVERVTELEAVVAKLTADKGLAGRVKALEDGLYKLEGRVAPREKST